MPKTVSPGDAMRVLMILREAYSFDALDGFSGPKIMSDSERVSIVWEKGPFEWTYRFCAEYGEKCLDRRIFIEPINTWSIGLYRED